MGVCHQMEKNWEEGRVTVRGFSFMVTSMVIIKISSLVEEGLKGNREKHPQRIELDFFTLKEKVS